VLDRTVDVHVVSLRRKLGKCGVIRAPAMPEVVVFGIETADPNGPFGAKGVGEAATNSVAAAYANALYNALGIRFYDLPITPEKILAALDLAQAMKVPTYCPCPFAPSIIR
jgi:CO/xanthine dehydrogenase Mo-binding subunit